MIHSEEQEVFVLVVRDNPPERGGRHDDVVGARSATLVALQEARPLFVLGQRSTEREPEPLGVRRRLVGRELRRLVERAVLHEHERGPVKLFVSGARERRGHRCQRVALLRV